MRRVRAFEEWQCRAATVEPAPGDTLLLYTDGVTEALSEMGEQFGESRLVNLLLRGEQLPASGLLQTILDTVQGFRNEQLHDDITLVAAHCLDLGEARLGQVRHHADPMRKAGFLTRYRGREKNS